MSFYGVAPVAFGTPSMVTATLGVNDPELGTRCHWQGAEYVFVYNAGTTQISIHQGAIVTGTSGYSVTVSSVTLTDELAGVCTHATMATGTYGWLQTKGWAIVAMGANNSAAVGERLCLGTDGNFGRVGSANTDTVLAGSVGKVMSAVASGGSAGCWIRTYL